MINFNKQLGGSLKNNHKLPKKGAGGPAPYIIIQQRRSI